MWQCILDMDVLIWTQIADLRKLTWNFLSFTCLSHLVKALFSFLLFLLLCKNQHFHHQWRARLGSQHWLIRGGTQLQHCEPDVIAKNTPLLVILIFVIPLTLSHITYLLPWENGKCLVVSTLLINLFPLNISLQRQSFITVCWPCENSRICARSTKGFKLCKSYG